MPASVLYYNHRKGRKTLKTRKGMKMKYEVIHCYEDSCGWEEEVVFSSDSLKECEDKCEEFGGWFSDYDYYEVR